MKEGAGGEGTWVGQGAGGQQKLGEGSCFEEKEGGLGSALGGKLLLSVRVSGLVGAVAAQGRGECVHGLAFSFSIKT